MLPYFAAYHQGGGEGQRSVFEISVVLIMNSIDVDEIGTLVYQIYDEDGDQKRNCCDTGDVM